VLLSTPLHSLYVFRHLSIARLLDSGLSAIISPVVFCEKLGKFGNYTMSNLSLPAVTHSVLDASGLHGARKRVTPQKQLPSIKEAE
jgi:hypothetical protein